MHSSSADGDEQEIREPGRTTKIFKILATKLISMSAKTGVLLFTGILLVIGVYGMAHLKMEFRPEWMLDPDAEGL